jgi:hypothetical protein
MIKRIALLTLILSNSALGQAITADIFKGGSSPNMAVADFRGGAGSGYMATFNSTLFGDLQDSGLFKMVPKSFYPLQVPQRPEDFRPTSGQGLAMADWAGTPVNANYLAFGYTAVQNGQLVLYGWLYDVAQQTLQGAQVIGGRYFGSPGCPQGCPRVRQRHHREVRRRNFGRQPHLLRFRQEWRRPQRDLGDGL